MRSEVARSEVAIPAPIVLRGRRALAEALDVMETVDRLLDESNDLHKACGVLLGGADGGGDPDCAQELLWGETTGHWEIRAILIAIADRIGHSTGSTSSHYAEMTPRELRQKFAHLLERPA